MSNLYSFICFEGEEEEKKFGQEEVNAILAKERRKTQEVQKQLMEQLEDSKMTLKAGSEEREALELRIEELSKLTMSAEERAKQKEEKLQEKYEEEIKSLQNERESWKNRHNNSLVSAAILKAASANKAVEPSQILKMLHGDVRVVQKTDEDGKDNFEARINFSDTKKDGSPVELDLTVDEAIKRMTELPQYGNLFEGGKISGMGGSNASTRSTGKIDVARLAKTDPAKYRELRKTNPGAIYGS